MVKKARSPVTYAKMKGIVSYFTALIKDKKLRSSHPVYRQMDFLRPEGSLSEADGAAAILPKVYSNPQPEESQSRVSVADFDYLKVIGTGSFGKVFLATQRENGRYYAVKVLKKHIILTRKEERNVMCEHRVLLKTLNHPFLVKLHFSFQTKDRLYLVLDYACGGELFYHLQREGVFGEPRARFYAAEMACALGYLHSLKIVYRDLKPENILLDSAGHVVLTDFGLCKEGMSRRGTTTTFCGTPEYLAPEVLLQKEYDRTVDWWGLGAVLHEMLYGLPPFYNADRLEMLRNIIYQPLVLKPRVSSGARDLLKRLLNRDRAKRLGAKHDLTELQSHPFFLSINWDELVAKKIPPPYVPLLSGPGDLTNIDPRFTGLPVPQSLGACQEYGATFPGFTYISENILPLTRGH
ncbi:serine/threonine-protein kinase Sgk1-like [Carassius auratus]|uniref:Serine/threonine-protein kinase Sgk1-like n=1 Tax=Carassius auratus TaxID=7957 RepID=A0A6P6LH75_CARAU|nr:serine/threonine-protein kinase Sgk1-like [Carassius auratus]